MENVMSAFATHLRAAAGAVDPSRPLDAGSAFLLVALLREAADHIDALDQELLAAGDVLEETIREFVAESATARARVAA
jgi:hypothetical protein